MAERNEVKDRTCKVCKAVLQMTAQQIKDHLFSNVVKALS